MKASINKKDLAALSSKSPRIKYPAAKKLTMLSAEHPDLLYPHIDFFVNLLQSENNILKWNAIDIIGNLAKVDAVNKIEKLLPRLFAMIDGGKLITAAHAVKACSNIASAKQNLRERIMMALLKVEQYTYETEECKNIMLSKTIESFTSLFKINEQKNEIIEFVKRQEHNSRPATVKKALKFLKHTGVNKIVAL